MGLQSFMTDVRKHCRFSLREIEELLTIALVFGFILTFRDWGGDTFDYVQGIIHLALGFLAVLFSIALHNTVKKVYAIYKGYTLEHRIWTRGLIASLLVGLFTNGRFPVYLSSSFELQTAKIRRLGRKSGVDVSTISHAALVGLVTTAIIAAIAHGLNQVLPAFIFAKTVSFNILYLAYNILPLPQIDGSKVFYSSRMWYAFAFTSILAFFLLTVVGYPSFILSLGVGIICTALFYIWYEKDF
jgi:hypothetical protein